MESESTQRRRFKVGEKTKQIDGENFDASSAQGTSGHIRAQGQGKIGILNRSIGIWRCLATNDDLEWYVTGTLHMNQSWCNCGAELRRPSPARRARDCNTASQQSSLSVRKAAMVNMALKHAWHVSCTLLNAF